MSDDKDANQPPQPTTTTTSADDDGMTDVERQGLRYITQVIHTLFATAAKTIEEAMAGGDATAAPPSAAPAPTTTTLGFVAPTPCYSCHPSAYVRRHATHKTADFVFGYDMRNRPLIIVTPRQHYHEITDMPAELVTRMFADIRQWLADQGICDYQTQLHFNAGRWQSHHHFHVKVRIDEQLYKLMRHRHFATINGNTPYRRSSPPPPQRRQQWRNNQEPSAPRWQPPNYYPPPYHADSRWSPPRAIFQPPPQ